MSKLLMTYLHSTSIPEKLWFILKLLISQSTLKVFFKFPETVFIRCLIRLTFEKWSIYDTWNGMELCVFYFK